MEPVDGAKEARGTDRCYLMELCSDLLLNSSSVFEVVLTADVLLLNIDFFHFFWKTHCNTFSVFCTKKIEMFYSKCVMPQSEIFCNYCSVFK